MNILDALAKDAPALVGLALLVAALLWGIAEIRKLRILIEPLASSPLVGALAGIR